MTLDFRRSARHPQADASGCVRRTLHAIAWSAVLAALAATTPLFTPAHADRASQTTREKDHFKTFDAAISRVRSYDLPVDEAARVRDCFKAINAREISKALDIRAAIKDPVALKLVNWYRLRGGYGTIAEYKAFLAENPAWPDRGTLNQRYEELLFSEGGSAPHIKAQFDDGEPKNGIGHAALASADLALGDTEKAKVRAVKAWREMTIPPNYETGFIERFGKFLTPADHKWRLDRMMMEDVRWSADRAERSAAIRRQMYRLPTDQQKLAEARYAVFMHSQDAKYDMAKVLYDAPKSDIGFLYHRIQNLRRQGKIDEATRLMAGAPTDPKLTPNLDDWWAERRNLAYSALTAGNSKQAYALVKDAGPLSINPAKEQAFMAGWIAMRFLKDQTAAAQHFAAAAKAADGPLSRSRAGYWLGRIAESKGEKASATAYYTEAAREIDTFYGQLSQLKLDPDNRRIDIKLPEPPTAGQIKRFNDLDAVKAVVVARKSGLEPMVQRLLVTALKNYFDNETDVAMTAHLADAIGDAQLALRISKTAIAKGQNMLIYAYPVHTYPSFTPLSPPPETAFLLGITRQETEFNKDTVSGAGAKGLMQVMTVTAQHVCKDYKITCELDRLLPDTAYNARIASAYIGDRMREFGGSYILGLSGYNAGPGRSREWIRAFGDPRDPKMDPIDWIERIPFTETREYVSKVLSNIQVYRARLGDEANALQLDRDLLRGRGKTGTPVGPD